MIIGIFSDPERRSAPFPGSQININMCILSVRQQCVQLGCDKPPPPKKDLPWQIGPFSTKKNTHTQTKSLIPTACLKDGCVQRTGANKTMAGSSRVTLSA